MRYLITVMLILAFTTTKAQTSSKGWTILGSCPSGISEPFMGSFHQIKYDTIKVHLQLSKRTSPHLIFEDAYQVIERKDNTIRHIKYLDRFKQEYPPKTIIWKIEKEGWL